MNKKQNDSNVLEIEDDNKDIEESKGENKGSKTSKKVVFEGHVYDLEDGQLIAYIEIYIPFIRKYIKINSCDLVKYIFGLIVLCSNIYIFYAIFTT